MREELIEVLENLMIKMQHDASLEYLTAERYKDNLEDAADEIEEICNG
jgi:hypothetical protein